MRLRHLTAELRGKDLELGRLLEDKMRVMGAIVAVLGGSTEGVDNNPPDYLSLVREKGGCSKEDLLNAVQVRCHMRVALISIYVNYNMKPD